jgi:alpha-L-rhamnosidase
MGSGPGDFSKQYDYNYSLVPWAEAFEVQADFSAGEDAAGIDLIDRAWGTMLRLGPSTFYEGSRYDGTPAYELGSQHDTVVHRWASGVGALLQQYVLGIEPSTAGFRSWKIEPHGGSLTWAHGRVPTPEGALSAWWQWDGPTSARRAYTLVVSAPSGTAGEVALPVPDRGVVAVDGRRVWTPGARAGRAHWDAGSGRIVVTGLGAGDHVIRWLPAS